jgi:predicted ferric reductase
MMLISAYVVIGLLPLTLAWLQDRPPRPWRDELASGLALTGFAMLLLEFVLSGRFRLVSRRIGIDLTMWFHQLMARTLTGFILIHPYLYTTPVNPKYPWDETGQLSLGLDALSFSTGMAAWVLLPVLVLLGIFRNQLPFRYETWRILHATAALLIALFGLQHALGAGRYSAAPELGGVWLVMVGLAAASLFHVHVLLPLWKQRHPYQVVTVRPVALRTWELIVEPRQGEALQFEAGQFVWLGVGGSPFSIDEHPFSISSCPAERPRIGFTIKEAGDFTSRIGRLAAGTPAWLDGPHGHFHLQGRQARRLVFIAGGVGIAPIIGILRQLRHERDPRPMQLIYGNRCQEQIAYAEEIAALPETLHIAVHHILSSPPPDWTGLQGHLDRPLLCGLLGEEWYYDTLYFVCGPPAMLDAVEHCLEQIGIPLRNIVFEKLSYN